MTPSRRRIFALVTVLGLLALAEGGARLWIGKTVGDAKSLTPDSGRLWRLAPLSSKEYSTDDDGFRAVSAPGPEGAPLLVTVGDSSIFGHGVADGSTIHESIGATLAARGAPARVRSLAVPGYSTMQTRVVMDELGWALQPKLLVIGNLWSDSTLDVVRDADLYRQYATPTARAELLLSRSGLFRLVKRAFNTSRGVPAERVISWPQPGDVGVRRVPLADYAANLEALLEGARERGIGVVILGLCTERMVWAGRSTLDPVFVYADTQYRVAMAHNVPYVDAVRVFSAAGGASLFGDDLHPNNAGSARLGEAIALELLRDGWPARVPVPLPAPAIRVAVDRKDGTARTEKTSMAGALANGEL